MSPAERTIIYMSCKVIDTAIHIYGLQPSPERLETVLKMIRESSQDLRKLADSASSQKDATTPNSTN